MTAAWAELPVCEKDVVCPPDPYALCVCGEHLQHHTPQDDPDAPLVPANAGCAEDAFYAWKYNRPITMFTLAPGQSLDCLGVSMCDGCDVDLCVDHSTEFTTCVESQYRLHHISCREQCTQCMRAVAEDANEDRAIEQWKGCW